VIDPAPGTHHTYATEAQPMPWGYEKVWVCQLFRSFPVVWVDEEHVKNFEAKGLYPCGCPRPEAKKET
jgi:hypothetical protein